MDYRVTVTVRVDVASEEQAEDEAFRLLWLHFYKGREQDVRVAVDPCEEDLDGLLS